MSGLFGKAPKPADPVRMPVAGDADTRAAEERKRRDIAGRSGRSSTILTRGGGGAAGVDAYKNTALGQAG